MSVGHFALSVLPGIQSDCDRADPAAAARIRSHPAFRAFVGAICGPLRLSEEALYASLLPYATREAQTNTAAAFALLPPPEVEPAVATAAAAATAAGVGAGGFLAGAAFPPQQQQQLHGGGGGGPLGAFATAQQLSDVEAALNMLSGASMLSGAVGPDGLGHLLTPPTVPPPSTGDADSDHLSLLLQSDVGVGGAHLPSLLPGAAPPHPIPALPLPLLAAPPQSVGDQALAYAQRPRLGVLPPALCLPSAAGRVVLEYLAHLGREARGALLAMWRGLRESVATHGGAQLHTPMMQQMADAAVQAQAQRMPYAALVATAVVRELVWADVSSAGDSVVVDALLGRLDAGDALGCRSGAPEGAAQAAQIAIAARALLHSDVALRHGLRLAVVPTALADLDDALDAAKAGTSQVALQPVGELLTSLRPHVAALSTPPLGAAREETHAGNLLQAQALILAYTAFWKATVAPHTTDFLTHVARANCADGMGGQTGWMGRPLPHPRGQDVSEMAATSNSICEAWVEAAQEAGRLMPPQPQAGSTATRHGGGRAKVFGVGAGAGHGGGRTHYADRDESAEGLAYGEGEDGSWTGDEDEGDEDLDGSYDGAYDDDAYPPGAGADAGAGGQGGNGAFVGPAEWGQAQRLYGSPVRRAQQPAGPVPARAPVQGRVDLSGPAIAAAKSFQQAHAHRGGAVAAGSQARTAAAAPRAAPPVAPAAVQRGTPLLRAPPLGRGPKPAPRAPTPGAVDFADYEEEDEGEEDMEQEDELEEGAEEEEEDVELEDVQVQEAKSRAAAAAGAGKRKAAAAQPADYDESSEEGDDGSSSDSSGSSSVGSRASRGRGSKAAPPAAGDAGSVEGEEEGGEEDGDDEEYDEDGMVEEERHR
jgi:hypothetical protein